jgi:hypothetical protein
LLEKTKRKKKDKRKKERKKERKRKKGKIMHPSTKRGSGIRWASKRRRRHRR